jgi:hypothetical protein
MVTPGSPFMPWSLATACAAITYASFLLGPVVVAGIDLTLKL